MKLDMPTWMIGYATCLGMHIAASGESVLGYGLVAMATAIWLWIGADDARRARL